MKHALCTYLIACILSLITAQADVPGQINYQGRLTDSDGKPVTGSKTLEVSIYDAASGGNLLYREAIGAVVLDASGIYSFQFGSEGDGVAAAIAGAPEHWLEISVDGVKQATRDRVLAVPFALNAARAESSDDGVSGVTVDVDGNLIVTLKDGSEINAGQVPKGDKGDQGPQGEQGPQGVSGTGIASASIDDEGNLVLTLTGGSQVIAGQVRTAPDWHMLYNDAYGEDGNMADISADGNIVALGSQDHGYLIILRYDGAAMQQYSEADVINGYVYLDLSLSADGKSVARGGRVFRRDADGQLVQLGADVDLVVENNVWYTSISADGNTMAVGAHGEYDYVNDSHDEYIRIYRYDGLSWQQLGGDIRDELREYMDPSISADGNTLAVGVREYDETAESYNWYLRVYRYNGLSWQQLGGDIRDDSYYYYSPSISDDGQTLAFSAEFEEDPITGAYSNIYKARVYRYNGSSWQKLGADFNDEANYNNASISGDGNTVAVKLLPDPYVEGREDARIYRYNGMSWQQLGRDILFGKYAPEGDEAIINSLNLSADGNTVVLAGSTYTAPNTPSEVRTDTLRLYRLHP